MKCAHGILGCVNDSIIIYSLGCVYVHKNAVFEFVNWSVYKSQLTYSTEEDWRRKKMYTRVHQTQHLTREVAASWLFTTTSMLIYANVFFFCHISHFLLGFMQQKTIGCNVWYEKKSDDQLSRACKTVFHSPKNKTSTLVNLMCCSRSLQCSWMILIEK